MASHFAVATDQLHAVKLAVESGRDDGHMNILPMAMYTLIRSTIETIGTAIWLLSPILSGDTAWPTSKEIKVSGTDNWIRIIEPGRPEFDANTDDPRVRQLLHSSDIDISTVFRGWFRLNVENGRSGINVLLAGAYKHDQYVETELQAAMTATDVLYRRLAVRHPELLPATVPLKAETVKLISDAEAALPPHLRGALRSKRAREVSAHERLSHLLDWVGPINFSTVVAVERQATWVTLAKDAREAAAFSRRIPRIRWRGLGCRL